MLKIMLGSRPPLHKNLEDLKTTDNISKHPRKRLVLTPDADTIREHTVTAEDVES